MLTFNIISIFPEFFDSPLRTSLLGKACTTHLLRFNFFNPRQNAESKHRHLDDAPYGGGPGMVMMADPIAKTIDKIKNPGKLILFTPAGMPLDSCRARELSAEENITLVCGRYEGIDARVQEAYQIEEIAIGNTILNGGETAALALIESVSRFLPGFMTQPQSLEDETYSGGLLEYPHYTRPANWRGMKVPEVLLNGNHKKIQEWRHLQSLKKTFYQRPDLLQSAPLCYADAIELENCQHPRAARNLCFCLLHYPVRLEKNRIGASSLTNLDVHDIARISRSYGMGPFYVATPLADQRDILERILRHWQTGNNEDRAKALAQVQAATDLEEVKKLVEKHYGISPFIVVTTAQWPKKSKSHKMLTPNEILKMGLKRPVLILLGTAKGLTNEIIMDCDGLIRPIRFLNDNHLSVRSAAAIIADRILGDFC